MERTSVIGGLALVLAFFLLIASWGWDEALSQQVKNGSYSGDSNDLANDTQTIHRLWNLGTIVAVIGAALVAFNCVRR
jgi:hypothetical protein